MTFHTRRLDHSNLIWHLLLKLRILVLFKTHIIFNTVFLLLANFYLGGLRMIRQLFYSRGFFATNRATTLLIENDLLIKFIDSILN